MVMTNLRNYLIIGAAGLMLTGCVGSQTNSQENAQRRVNAPTEIGVTPRYGHRAPMVSADIDNDGDVDIVVGANYKQQSNGIDVLLNDGKGNITQRKRIVTLPTGISCDELVVDDFNGDGIKDLAVGSYNLTNNGQTMYRMMGKKDGTYSRD
jgi:hypothetical protein